MATAAQQKSPPEQRIILKNVSWKTYECLLADHLDSSVPRFTYDQGVLEIVSPSTRHEEIGFALALLVEIIALERSIDVRNVGSMTFKRKDLLKGFEPDASFYIENEPHVADKEEIDAATDPPPDLVIEVDVTSPSLNKLPIFAQMGIPEVWRYRVATGDVVILRLVDDGYRDVAESKALPPLTHDVLTRFVTERRSLKRTDWLRTVQAWARGEDSAHHNSNET